MFLRYPLRQLIDVSEENNLLIIQTFVPLRGTAVDIDLNAIWQENGTTVAGGNGWGNQSNQLYQPWGLFLDDSETIYVADSQNHRIMAWTSDATSGEVVAGGNGRGNGSHQLSYPRDLVVDKVTDSFIIADFGNKRVVWWPRQNGTHGETILSEIDCLGLTMDENGSLYVAQYEKHEVRQYRRGESNGTKVAGGNGGGSRTDQLNGPRYIFVYRDGSLYVSDWGNHRVMKWAEGATHGTVVAGGQGYGSNLTELSYAHGVVVDQLATVYVADQLNHRIMRWPKGNTQGNAIIGGNGRGGQPNQLHEPAGLSFDQYGNLYVVDFVNHRVQKFNLTSNF
ncbi:unnamed protein product [Rotaria socialis]